jgi:alkylated DNA nucleotide flippase Atl1
LLLNGTDATVEVAGSTHIADVQKQWGGDRMSHRKKSWQEKLADKRGLPKILSLEKRFPCYNAVHKMGGQEGDKVVLVNPSEVVEIMKNVPQGKLITIVEICRRIAKKHGVEACCSLTTGIFIMIAANAAEEAARQGKNLGIPYWRTLKANGFLNEKYPGGAEAQRKLLEKEGFEVAQKGKKYLVQSYQNFLTG